MLSQDDEEVGLYFVIPASCNTKEECDTIMVSTFKECEEQELNPQWLTEKTCLKIEADKKMVFVFQEFKGEAFTYLKQFKSVLVGPRCLLACFEQNTQLPHLPYPFFTMAMNSFAVSASGFGPAIKETLKKKIELMAGIYSPQLISSTTHLIVKAARSEKYEKALKMSVPVMTEDWVDAVYEASLKGTVLASDSRFEKYKCPALKGLVICTSNVSSSEKRRLTEIISANGGTFDGKLHAKVDILVVTRPEGEKFRYARSWNLPCVNPQWVFDSVEQGRALAPHPYEVRGTKCSTPTKEDLHFQSFADMSVVSNIALEARTQIDDTMASMASTFCETPSASFKMPLQRPGGFPPAQSTFAKPFAVETPASARPVTPIKTQPYKKLLEELDFEKTKRAGQFLDGCKVYLYGFGSEEEEKLRRVLKGSGASRFTELTESVTHILVGDSDPALMKQLKTLSYRPHVVSLHWLVQSVALRSPAPEEQYSCGDVNRNAGPETPSPLSKKGLALLQRGDESPISRRDNDTRPSEGGSVLSSKKSAQLLKELRDPKEADDELASLYRNEGNIVIPAPKPLDESSRSAKPPSDLSLSMDTSTVCSQQNPVFAGLKFVLVGLADEARDEIDKMISQFGGEIVRRSFKGVPDYAIVPLTGAKVTAASEIVTALWVEQCLEKQSIVEPVEYFHQPISMHADRYPLRGCVIGMSGYVGKERTFVSEVAGALGAVTQEILARKDNKAKNAKASTHLICKTAEGSKYAGAKKWKLPVVTHHWVMECCKTGTYVPVEPYLLDPTQELAPFPIPEAASDLSSDLGENQTSGLKSDASEEKKCQTPCPTKSPPGPLEAATPSTSADGPAENGPENRSPGEQKNSGKSPVFTPRTIQQIEAAYMTPKTPETPYGFSANPSPGERKAFKKWLDRLPDFKPPPEPAPRRDSTPMSELRRQFWAKFGVRTPKHDRPDDEDSDDPEGLQNGSAKRRKCEPTVDADPNTPTTATNRIVPRNLGLPEIESPAQGQLDKINQLLKTPAVAPTTNPAIAGPSTSLSPVKDKPTKFVPKEGSQPYFIQWNDPASKAMSKSSSSEENGTTVTPKRKSTGDDDDDDGTPSRKEPSVGDDANLSSGPEREETSPAHIKKETSSEDRVFMLSNVVDRDRRKKMLDHLGARVIETDGFDKAVTHLIVDKPVRSEKLLASIASGKWVLHTSYIVQSYKKKQFLKEEDYEWGSPRNPELKKMVAPGGVEDQLACGAYRWRQKLSGKEEGAFQGMRAIILAMPHKMKSFLTLIEAGGGTVLSISEMETATHCFVDQNKAIPVDTKKLSELGVPCLPLLYLQDFLLKDPPPNPATWCKRGSTSN